MYGMLPPELLIGRDCLVGQHQPPSLAAAHHQLNRVAEKAAGHHRIIQLAGTGEIVPSDFNRTLYQQGQRFRHLHVQPFLGKRPAAISVPDPACRRRQASCGGAHGPPATAPAITIARSSKSILPLTTRPSEFSMLSDCGLFAACRFSSATIASFSFSSSIGDISMHRTAPANGCWSHATFPDRVLKFPTAAPSPDSLSRACQSACAIPSPSADAGHRWGFSLLIVTPPELEAASM